MKLSPDREGAAGSLKDRRLLTERRFPMSPRFDFPGFSLIVLRGSPLPYVGESGLRDEI